jgi:hypothetical protein
VKDDRVLCGGRAGLDLDLSKPWRMRGFGFGGLTFYFLKIIFVLLGFALCSDCIYEQSWFRSWEMEADTGGCGL